MLRRDMKYVEDFKQKIDEEYYPIVDLLVSNHTFEEFRSLKNEDKVTLDRNYIHQMWESVNQDNVNIAKKVVIKPS